MTYSILMMTILITMMLGFILLLFGLREHFVSGETLMGAFTSAGASMLICFILTLWVYYVG